MNRKGHEGREGQVRKLPFADFVRDGFAFLADYGFTVTLSETDRVRYESATVYIEVLHGQRDGEVAVSFGRLAPREEYSFTLFLRKKNPALERQMGERLADTPDEMRECITRLAGALQGDGMDILRGNPALFEEMKDVRWWHFSSEA